MRLQPHSRSFPTQVASATFQMSLAPTFRWGLTSLQLPQPASAGFPSPEKNAPPCTNPIESCTSPICTSPRRHRPLLHLVRFRGPRVARPPVPIPSPRRSKTAPRSPHLLPTPIKPETFDNTTPARLPISQDTLSTRLHPRAFFYKGFQRVTPALENQSASRSPPFDR